MKDGQPGIEPAMLGFISSCYQLGSIFGVPIAPWLNQRYGRRWSIMIGSIIMCIGAILQAFAQHGKTSPISSAQSLTEHNHQNKKSLTHLLSCVTVAMYIVARLLLGIGIVFAIISGSSMIGELGYPKERATLTSLFNSSWFIGSIIACAIALATVDIPGEWSWRLPSILQLAPSILQICTVFLLPESPRWLISQDRDDEAFAILTKYHAEGDANSVLVQAEMAQIRTTIKIEMEHSRQSWWEMIATAGMRKRVLIATFLGLFTQYVPSVVFT